MAGKKSLKGENAPPHSGCRQFMGIQDRETQMKFSLNRYTMALSYLLGDVWSLYGLEEAVRWFRKTKLSEEAAGSRDIQYNRKVRRFGAGENNCVFLDGAVLNQVKLACKGEGSTRRQYEQIRKKADEMYATWCGAGKPVKKLWGEAIVLENLLYPGEEYRTEPGFSMSLKSEAGFPDSGIYIFRNGYGSGKESYCALMASPKPIGHGHLDQGSFLIYKDSVPVVMDSGMEGYFDSGAQWHISSYSHAVMQFKAPPEPIKGEEDSSINLSAGNYSRKRGWKDLPRKSRVLGRSLGKTEEYVALEIEEVDGSGRQVRTIYHQREADIYVIRDQVTGYDGPVLFSLPTVMRTLSAHGNEVKGEGWYGVNLQVLFLTPTERIWAESGRCFACFPQEGDTASLAYVRAAADAKNGFVAVVSAGEETEVKKASLSEGRIILFMREGRERMLVLPKVGS